MTAPLLPGPMWLIGCGNMAGAMLEGWLSAGIDPNQITVVRPSARPPSAGIRTLASLPEGEVPAIILLGVKPQKLDEVAPALARATDSGTIIVSILAGVEIKALRARFERPRAIVRAMPNLPVALRKGVVPLHSDLAPGDPARVTIERQMASLGHAEWFEDESHFALAGHLTAAAPAFLFRFLDALSEAAAELGLPIEQAQKLAAQMAVGAATLAEVGPESPSDLARRVASPGGTTEAGLKILDSDDGLKALMLRTLAASRRRGEEMAEAASLRP